MRHVTRATEGPYIYGSEAAYMQGRERTVWSTADFDDIIMVDDGGGTMMSTEDLFALIADMAHTINQLEMRCLKLGGPIDWLAIWGGR